MADSAASNTNTYSGYEFQRAPGQSAAQTYANLTRQQWQDYMTMYVPVENQLIQFANDPTQAAQAAEKASQNVQQSFAAQEAAQGRRLAGMGIQLSQEEQAAAQRETGLSRAIADVQARNTAATETREMQKSVLGQPTPGMTNGTMNQPIIQGS